MITPGDLQRAEYIIKKSGVVQILQDGMARSPRGRKPNLVKMELLLIGMLLSVMDRGISTIKSAHKVLTEDLPLNEQLRLRIVTGSKNHPRKLSIHDCYYQVEIVTQRLAYGHSTRMTLSPEERTRRRQVVIDFNNALMDVFATALDVDDSTVAIDGTGLWAWARGGAYDPPTTEEIEKIEDPAVREQLLRAVRLGELRGTGPDNETIKLMKRHVDKSTTSTDQDAGWGGKTAKDGTPEPYFGYMIHALANVPKAKLKDDPSAPPVLIRRFEVSRAADDVVDPTFRLIDSLPSVPKDILVDRHYSYKEYSRWQQPLIQRDIRQHFDLRSDEHGAIYVKGMPVVDGCVICPGRPVEMDVIEHPGIFATREQLDDFHDRIEEREQFLAPVKNRQNANGSIKVQCPADAGSIGCARRPGTVEQAIRDGKPIVENPPSLERDGVEPPPLCIGKTVRITLPEPVAKINQVTRWGSREWAKMYGARTYIEGVFGNFKNPSTENLHRGTTQIMGQVWANINMAIIASAYNL